MQITRVLCFFFFFLSLFSFDWAIFFRLREGVWLRQKLVGGVFLLSVMVENEDEMNRGNTIISHAKLLASPTS